VGEGDCGALREGGVCWARGASPAANWGAHEKGTVQFFLVDTEKLGQSPVGRGGQAQFAPKTPHDHRSDGARPVPSGLADLLFEFGEGGGGVFVFVADEADDGAWRGAAFLDEAAFAA
jgi:hypothetical protein